MRKTANFWTEQECLKAAKDCSTLHDFITRFPGAYNSAKENDWMKGYTWLSTSRLKPGYWNENTCMEEAKKYSTIKDFSKYAGRAYNVALKNGWLESYTWLRRLRSKNNYWDYDTCYSEAIKYKTKSEFIKSSSSAYSKAFDNNWLKDYDWFISVDNQRKHCVYVYLFPDDYFYIGLTMVPEDRDRRHRSDPKSAVNIHSKESNLPIPNPEYLQTDLTPAEAQDYEGKYIQEYLNKGYKKLNRASTGKGIGSLGGGCFANKWTEALCYQEAKKYTKKIDFIRKSNSAFRMAQKHGWISQYSWFIRKSKPKGYWSKENCYNEARKYKTKKEFSRNAAGAYDSACRNDWIKDYDWFQR